MYVWVVALLSAVAVGLVSFFWIGDVLKFEDEKQIQISIAIFPLIALFSLYVADFLNRLDDVFHKIPKNKVNDRRKILNSWYVVYIAHGAFTVGIILTFVCVCLKEYQLAINLGVSAFCAGYTALIVSSAQMLIHKCCQLKKLEVNLPKITS